MTTSTPRETDSGRQEPQRGGVPLLVFDGDCRFCVYWVRVWQELVGAHVEFAPMQVAAPRFPAIPPSAFRDAVRYIAPDGRVASGAEASFLTLAHAPGHAHWIRWYRRLPGFAAASEAGYRWIATHRPLCTTLTRCLWGARPEPVRDDLVRALFVRLLGLIYLAAFWSLGSQVLGLVGSDGILPATSWLAGVYRQNGASAWLLHPTLFWIDSHDATLVGVCVAGAIASLAVAAGRFTGPGLLLCWVAYLSLYHAGQLFLDYQWDLLLLEAGFLGWLLTSGSRIPLWLLRWLLFRFMVLSGAVKWASGDPSWRSLHALGSYLETQPLPSPLAWVAASAPQGLLAALVALHFVIECGLPFLIFLPRRPRRWAAAGFVALQLPIMATGSYGFFNLLALALVLTLTDDSLLRAMRPSRAVSLGAKPWRAAPGATITVALSVFACMTLGVGAMKMVRRIEMAPDTAVLASIEPLHVVNAYGVFAHVPLYRREIVLQGSDDGRHWTDLEFRYKPGEVDRAPGWNVPHQPRLDWQMWFAALGDARDNPWLPALLGRLLEGSPQVAALMQSAQIGGRPFVQVRAMLYRYRFAPPERRAQGIWWEREFEREYLAPVSRETAGAALRRDALPQDLIRWR